jgi:hypothetical protein
MAAGFGWVITAAGEAKQSMVRDLGLDPVTHDFVLQRGDLPVVAGAFAVAQSMRICFRLGRFEYFLDVDGTEGIPWLQSVYRKQTSPLALASIFRSRAERLPGVAEVPAFVTSFDAAQRKLTMNFRATTDLGELIVGNGAALPEEGVS